MGILRTGWFTLNPAPKRREPIALLVRDGAPEMLLFGINCGLEMVEKRLTAESAENAEDRKQLLMIDK